MRLNFRCLLLTWVLAMASQVAVADDGQVAQQLSEQLRKAQQTEQLKGFRINVKVENGVVWMKGSVKDKRQREKALDVARRVEGVRLVVNDLTLEGAEGIVSPATNLAANAAQPANRQVSAVNAAASAFSDSSDCGFSFESRSITSEESMCFGIT